MQPIICPSVLAADFAHLGDAVKKIEEAKADRIHIDVMDGLFVPNLTIGPQVVAAINRSTNLFLDVHLMMYNPFGFIERFVESGADLISFHIEATEDVKDTIDYIRRCDVKVGIALSPETPPELVDRYLPLLDQVLVMTVQPGFGGQSFMPDMVAKIEYIHAQLKRIKREKECLIQVDGGIDFDSAAICAKAGASVLVSGTFLLSQPNLSDAIDQMRRRCRV